ncbi:MAG: SlyX family protein [Bythopirellula sp.]|nr:SlyX family protein [Bythopirellula sp.]
MNTALEEQLAFQQRQLDQLNAVVLEQQAELERLRREVAGLTEVLRGVVESSGTDLPHEKPPHY